VVCPNPDSLRSFAWPHTMLWFALPVGAIFNVALGALAPPFDLLNWGVYAGEYLALAIWASWGPGPHASRLCATAVTGSVWMLTSWSAWFAFRVHHGLLGLELEHMLTVVPPAFAISTSLMWALRLWGWRFHWPRVLSLPASPLAIRFLACVLPAVWFRVSIGLFQQGDLFWSAVLGVLLGTFALVVAPWLAVAFLGKKLRPWWLLPASVLSPAPGLMLAAQFPIPSGGGSTHLYSTAVVASVTALVITILAFLFWRRIGIRNSAHTAIP